MLNLRVVRRFNEDGDPWYTVEDIVPEHLQRDVFPIVRHEPHGLIFGHTVEELRERLQEILKALDRPTMTLRPARREPSTILEDDHGAV